MTNDPSTEEQLREWVNQLAPEHKQVLLGMLAEDDRVQRAARLDFAVTQLERLCADRSLSWDSMTESERESFLDSLIRENEMYSTHVGGTASAMIAPCHQCGRDMAPSDLYRIYFGERPPSTERSAAMLVVMDMDTDANFPLLSENEIMVGRLDPHRGIRPDVDLSRYDPASRISRRHARITARGHQYFIEDMGSANGTIVNGRNRLKPQEPYPLVNGDVVKLGETTLKFVG